MPFTAERQKLVKVWESNSLEEHVYLVQRQVKRSLRDSQTIHLAQKVVSGTVDDYVYDRETNQEIPVVYAWSRAYRVPPENGKCGPRDANCELTRIWNFYVTNVRYVLDPKDFDYFKTLKYTLEDGAGDCDDAVIALAAMLQAVGFENTVARVVSTNGKHWEHIYLLVGLPKTCRTDRCQWIPLDPTVQGVSLGWQYQNSTNKVDFRLR